MKTFQFQAIKGRFTVNVYFCNLTACCSSVEECCLVFKLKRKFAGERFEVWYPWETPSMISIPKHSELIVQCISMSSSICLGSSNILWNPVDFLFWVLLDLRSVFLMSFCTRPCNLNIRLISGRVSIFLFRNETCWIEQLKRKVQYAFSPKATNLYVFMALSVIEWLTTHEKAEDLFDLNFLWQPIPMRFKNFHKHPLKPRYSLWSPDGSNT